MDEERKRLHGLRVLVVEDVAVLAWRVCDVLADAGAEVVGPAPSVETALDLLAHQDVHAAVLDKNLDGLSSDPVADALLARNTPFLFLTGYGSGDNEGRYGEWLTVGKPVRPATLIESVAGIADRNPQP